MDLLKNLVYRAGATLTAQVSMAEKSDFFRSIRPLDAGLSLIRLGGDADGGYLLPDDLDGIEACFSPGVDVTATFENALLARGIRCFQADASVERSPLEGREGVDFERKFLGIVDDETTVTLNRWVRDKLPGSTGDLVLQMDIEGGEWLALAATDEDVLKRFRIMVIECHWMQRAVDTFGLAVIGQVFRKLLRHHVVVHAHPNNWRPLIDVGGYKVAPLTEYTFLRRDRVRGSLAPVTHFPHALDVDNVPHHAHFPLSRSMYDHPEWR